MPSYTKGKTDNGTKNSKSQSYDNCTYKKDIKISEEKNTDNNLPSVSEENKESDTNAKEEKRDTLEGIFASADEKTSVKNGDTEDKVEI